MNASEVTSSNSTAPLSLAALREAERDRHIADNLARVERRLAAAKAADCAPCEHNVLHGWWGEMADGAQTHCVSCHRGWSSYREAHCTVCCAHFVSTKASDKHRRRGVCMDPAGMTRRDGQPLFVERARTSGVTWALAFYGTLPAHWGHPAAEKPSEPA